MSGGFKANLALIFFVAAGIVIMVVSFEGTRTPGLFHEAPSAVGALQERFGRVPVGAGFIALGIYSWFHWRGRSR
ncbi:hypothetical protein JQU17_05395 [Ponticoccus sp. SC2-23]|uniref:hypothetical protein n=1 Tax=Alexandriicola marinus TaxID=2081710 RepID=UPI000FD8702B|nr:hypothetical protein [Alexandriicola marinus]MBM1219624.1 hypothetical protein [Ponticoccus sp. SC6-9]MBM1223304.1 hypothetical protein [Ponticoccus sp. SC6-15]MBM1229437.1 hypothetical protein [Ponticoccus sp. SC6-38]MBM1232270.1 hypothetical protein [Ponticoccus sp. SC6-45]MBM1237780.1 hypothetical protein [Ponticoccus sp. SC6-49]MBM1241281.1 hypothetical protein [Ponticoccus sp. SC2-64]MBM1245794.1 hypothetical protein [Ponticoccus sp. SC6-42]MBM1250272.1 hypothetical protein [Pontico